MYIFSTLSLLHCMIKEVVAQQPRV